MLLLLVLVYFDIGSDALSGAINAVFDLLYDFIVV